MECPFCETLMEYKRTINGQMIYKCPFCGYKKETPDLEPPQDNDIKEYQENWL